MSKNKTKSDLFSPREVASALNNSVTVTGRPASGEIPEARKRKLRDYAQAGIEIILEHIEEGLLSAEEATHVQSCAALYIHTRHVQGSEKLPASKEAKKLYEN